MYGPSFFTGALILRLGAVRTVAGGLVLTALSVVAALAGAEVGHFWLMLIPLGLGWNLSFVGASALVLECHRAEETTRVQSLNDFIIFGMMAIGTFASGSLLSDYGWRTVLWFSLAPLFVAAVALVPVAATRRSRG